MKVLITGAGGEPDQQHPPRRAIVRLGTADSTRATAGNGDRRDGRAAASAGGPVGSLRISGAGYGDDRNLRRDVLLRRAAHPGDRRPNGARRREPRRSA